uniref:GG21365 n=1 Tax=Drosophila erecta TaxID=7220 RepID=B3P0P9_DROER
MVNVPPLLCSTPPPIDFGEEDDDSGLQATIHLDEGDEYSNFGLVSSSKEPPPPPDPVEEFREKPPDLLENKQTAEAFNYQVKQTMDYEVFEETAPPTPPPLSLELDDEELEEQVPSLKLDSLSLYSTESVSAASTLSPVGETRVAASPAMQTTKAHVLSHQVTLEDVSDDSDEECSPKKPKELFIREGAVDFFAIEVLATPTLPNGEAFSEENVAPGKESVVNTPQQEESFRSLEVQEESSKVKTAPTTEESSNIPPTEPDDGFDDFQEFATPANGNHGQSEDDDDFGDFAEPVVAAVFVPPPPPPAAVHLSIDERVKPVLEMMFPQSKELDSKSMDNRRPLAQCQRFNFGAIEHARALDYQWSSSEMRHALVRSLGIDSRNILFGDKWNSSMPRFAANLSFDPLKPLKPQSTGAASCLEPISNPTSYQGLENAPATTTSKTETRASPPHGEGSSGPGSGSNSDGEERHSHSYQPTADPSPESNHIESTAAASAAAVAAAAATLSTALSADSPAHKLNGGEQLHQQRSEPEQFDLRTIPPAAPPAQEEIVGSSMASYSVPLKETHIYTPSKSDTAVAKTTTLAPIDFDYEMAATGIIIDETVVKKEYRDVEYKPPFGLDSPSKLSANGAASSFQLPPQTTEDDDFSDFQSMPAPRSRIDTPTFGEQMILSPAILLPQAIPLAKKPAATIEWGDNALSSINAEEMARIEELFSSQAKPLTISASVAKKPAPSAPAQSQPQEDDEWSDFVSVPVTQQQPHHQQNAIANNNNIVNSNTRLPAAPKEDDWSDFVSSTPPARPAPQFNSGAWQSANFYNNPLSLYQAQQHQQQSHSNLVPKGSSSSNNNNVPAIPQQIHIMHDFSTAPVPGGLGVGATYQQQHQRQQFQIGNAKVAPRISLIPDLSFVAPALPTNAGAFMGALPKPSFGAKK